jgi:hypothetical protein
VKIRFLADADLNKAILNGVLRRGMTDAQVLALAATTERVLVSHDFATMPAQFRAFRDAGNHSAGVFLISQTLDIGAAIDELLLIWLASDASEWTGRLVWLPV